MLTSVRITHGNRLLATLPRKERQRFVGECKVVDLLFADVLCNPGERMQYVFFPTGSVISLTAHLDEHDSLGVGLIGNEGMLGASLILGVDTSPLRASVQGAGGALRMARAPFCREMEKSALLQQGMKRYLYVEMCQFAQSAACNRFHLLLARLARWLLMTQDRMQTSEFHVTQEFLAKMLGVRRVGVTRAASTFQASKLISYSRGQISILDRAGLEAASCGCYLSDKESYARLLAA